MKLPVRRLIKNSSGYTTSATAVPQSPKETKSPVKHGDIALIKGKSVDLEVAAKAEKVPAQAKSDQGVLETANAGSMITSRTMYSSILEGYLVSDVDSTDSNQSGNRTKDSSLNRIHRDIFRHDPVCGAAVELMGNMPFSDFSLGGSKDKKVYQKYEDSLNNVNAKALHPKLSNEYLVQGLFVATTLFDKEENIYTGIVPQNIDYVDITPVPIFGRDPLITLQIGEASKATKSDDERMQQYTDLFPKEDVYKPQPEDVIYIPRSGLMRDYRGVSIYSRMLSAWLIERALYRGTIDQAMKRQKPITHLMLGEPEWTPTQEEMAGISDMLLSADLDPVGSVFVTRTGVSVSDIRSSGDLWKVSDLESYFTTIKLRGMGVSEAFISGDANYNSMEQAMTVFIEQMRAYREMITYELYYDRMFPRIASTNEFANKKWALETAGFRSSANDWQEVTGRSLKFSATGMAPRFVEQYNFEFANEDGPKWARENRKNLFIPEIHWHKRLRPEADTEYLGLLATLQENNIPIPVRIWAAAGGLNLDALMAQEQEDLKVREKLKAWMKQVKPPEQEGMPGGGGGEFASLFTADTSSSKGLLSRQFGEQAETQNIYGGKRHILSAKGKKVIDERVNKQIAETASKLGQQMNRIEKILEDRFRDANQTSKTYTA